MRTKINDNLIKLNSEDFDNKMCADFPIIFQDRKKPMSETCMCWGFSIGRGWYSLLYNLCQKIDKLYKLTGIGVKAVQVKEKYGSLRFYTSPSFNERVKQAKENLKIDDETAKVIVEILDDCVSVAEYKSDKTCAECGEHYYGKITIGGWVYDVCEKCFIKLHPDRIDGLNDWKKLNEFSQFASDLSIDYWHKKELPSEKCKKIMDDLLEEFKQYNKKEKAKETKKNKKSKQEKK